MNSKALFLKSKDVPAFWASICGNDNFEIVLTFARSEFAESQPTQDELKGAEKFIQILRTISSNEESNLPFPSAGLIHQIDKMPDKPKES